MKARATCAATVLLLLCLPVTTIAHFRRAMGSLPSRKLRSKKLIISKSGSRIDLNASDFSSPATYDTPNTNSASGDLLSKINKLEISIPPSVSPYISAAFQKCYGVLDDVAVNGTNEVTRMGYVLFLNEVSNGDLNFMSFSELPAFWFMIFYATSCTSGQNCVDNPPVISLELSEPWLGLLAFLCSAVLQRINTVASVTFEYQVRFDNQTISETELGGCLNSGTESLLIDQLANCSNHTVGQNARFLRESDRSRVIMAPDRMSMFKKNKSSRRASLRSLDYVSQGWSSDVTKGENCPYTIQSDLVRLVQLPCNPPASSASVVCALIRSTVTVTTSQYAQPYEQALEDEIVTVLRRAINGGAFVSYLPDGCLLAY